MVRIWQANIGKTIIAHVPITNGQVQETGDFELDGVTFPAAEIVLEFIDPSDDGDDGGAMFPTGNLVDTLDVPGVGSFPATMISAGIPTIFVNAADIGYQGTELRDDINNDPAAAGAFRKNPRRRGAAHGPDPNAGRSRSSASTRPRLPLSARPRATPPPAAKPLKRAMWTCWCAPCPWASCTTP